MSRTPVRVRNLDRLDRKLAALSRLAQGDVLEQALHAGAQEIRNAAQDKAPYLTGTLRRSIHSETTEKSGTRVVVQVGTDLEYAAMQEFGGEIVPKNAKRLVFEVDGKKVFAKKVAIPAHPYLRPAFDEQKSQAVRQFRLAVADQVRQVASGK